MNIPRSLNDFGREYAEAWSSQQPENVAQFYSRDGVLIINNGDPAVGHDAISEAAQAFMSAFPDLEVMCDRVIYEENELRWYWTMKGTNTDPGGTGNELTISGYEALELDPSGKIRSAIGFFDEEDYQRQLLESH